MKYWDAPLNPITGNFCECEIADHCWAKGGRFKSPHNKPIWNSHALRAVTLTGRAQVLFVCNTCDLAHSTVKDEDLSLLFGEINYSNWVRSRNKRKQHTFLILTKYPKNLWTFIQSFSFWYPQPSKVNNNIFIGTTITGLRPDLDKERLKALAQFNIAGFKTWVSVEPLLGAIPCLRGYWPFADQVIVGGETGVNARYMEADWARDIRDTCHQYNIPFFFKSWGKLGYNEKNHGRLLDGVEHNDLIWEAERE